MNAHYAQSSCGWVGQSDPISNRTYLPKVWTSPRFFSLQLPTQPLWENANERDAIFHVLRGCLTVILPSNREGCFRNMLPAIEKHETGWSLLVDGAPTILLGGQVHNSSTSDTSYTRKVFSKAKNLNYNFVIGSVNWNQLEPIEGQFDFTLVEGLIKAAEDNNLKLVILWFGAFKNAVSTYAPTWVRSDKNRFTRAELNLTEGSSTRTGSNPVISIFSKNLLQADSKAFCALMKFLKETDGNNTVVMVQIENETGLLGASRDFCNEANSAWNTDVPTTLIDGIQTRLLPQDLLTKEIWIKNGSKSSGTWAEVFGDAWESHEIFMAWHMGAYADSLAKAGKSIKNLPMYVNAWLGPQPGQDVAGQWPSGGPAKNVLGVWKIAAPNIDLLAPDIYIPDAATVMADYAREDNPLFIPESRHSAGNLFWALGNHDAIGYSMFGAEDGRVGNQMSEAFGILKEASNVIALAQREKRIKAVVLEPDQLELSVYFAGLNVKCLNSLGRLKRFVEVAGLDLEIKDFESKSELEESDVLIPSNSDSRPFALIIQESETEFLLIGKGINLEFTSEHHLIEIDKLEEGSFVSNKWIAGRELNGDERLQFVPLHDLGCAKIKILKFEK